MPDATGLELIAQELRDRDADGVLDTVFFRDKAAILVTPGDRAGHARAAARQGLPLPGLRARRRLLPRGAAPRRPLRAARHEHAWTASRSRRACTIDDPHVPSVTPEWPTADHQEREIYDMFGVVFDGHPNHDAASSCPRTTRATRSAATSRSAASRSSSPTTSRGCRGTRSEAEVAQSPRRPTLSYREMEESVELSPHRPRGRRRAGAADAQHGPAPPRHARGAAAADHARGRGRARRQADHRLRPHRHREDRRGQGVLEGHPRHRADGLPLLLLQRDGLLRRRRDAARTSRSRRAGSTCASSTSSSTGSPRT